MFAGIAPEKVAVVPEIATVKALTFRFAEFVPTER